MSITLLLHFTWLPLNETLPKLLVALTLLYQFWWPLFIMIMTLVVDFYLNLSSWFIHLSSTIFLGMYIENYLFTLFSLHLLQIRTNLSIRVARADTLPVSQGSAWSPSKLYRLNFKLVPLLDDLSWIVLGSSSRWL